MYNKLHLYFLVFCTWLILKMVFFLGQRKWDMKNTYACNLSVCNKNRKSWEMTVEGRPVAIYTQNLWLYLYACHACSRSILSVRDPRWNFKNSSRTFSALKTGNISWTTQRNKGEKRNNELTVNVSFSIVGKTYQIKVCSSSLWCVLCLISVAVLPSNNSLFPPAAVA